MRKAIVLYTDLWPAIHHLPDQDLGQLTRLLFEHQINGSEPDPLHPLFMAFGFIKAQMQSATKQKTAVTLTDQNKSEKRKAHLFRNSKYHNNPELFIHDFTSTKTFQRHPEIDPQLLFDDIQTSTDATDKYKYTDWLAAAQNWCKRDVKRYTKRTFHTNPADNRMAEQIARVIANPIDPITGRPWNEPDTGGGQWQEPFSY
jgi:hypothetical protein